MTFRTLGLLLAALTLTACDDTLKIEDGRVPQQFLPYARELVGEYRGTVEGRANVITFRLDGDRFVANARHDLVMDSCNSIIGNLKEVSYSGKESDNSVKITTAKFDFNPNNCFSIQGKELVISGIEKKEGHTVFRTSILSESYMERVCHWEPMPPPGGGMREVCEYQQRQYFIDGRFAN